MNNQPVRILRLNIKSKQRRLKNLDFIPHYILFF